MRRRVMASLGKTIPYLRDLSYIKSTGTQFVDIGVHGNQDSRFEIGVKCFGTVGNSNATRVLGSQFSTDTSISMYMSNGNIAYSIRFGNSGTIAAVGYLEKGVYADLIFDKTGIRSKDLSKTYYNITTPILAFDTMQNIVLFKNDLSSTSFGLCEIYYFKMFDNNEIVRDMKPVMSLDNKPCFYDKVSGQLFSNQGTGEFSWGEITDNSAGGGINV